MDNMIKNALKYTIGIVVFLTALALYFFFMMSKNLSHQEQPSMISQEANPAPQSNSAQQQCELVSNDAELSSLKQDLSRARQESSACSVSLNESSQSIARLQDQLQSMPEPTQDNQSELQDELQQAINTADELRTQITALEEEKQQLISAANSDDTQDEKIAKVQSDLAAKNTENRELSSRITSLEKQLSDSDKKLQENLKRLDVEAELEFELAKLKQDNIALIAKISEFEASSDDSPAVISNVLAIEKFETLPTFCEQHSSATRICVSSLDMVTNFNFLPNGFISLRLVGPDGSTIQRESIAAQQINLYSFSFDDEILDAGEYTVEVKIDDVFNQFNSEQRFTLELPIDIQNQLQTGQ